MSNLALGLGAAGLGAVALGLGGGSSSAGAAAGTENYLFKDYAWIVIMPSTSNNLIAPGDLAPQILSALPPPQGLSSSSGGRWVEYPQGYRPIWGKTLYPAGSPGAPAHVDVTTPPGQPGNPIYPVWPNIPRGLSVYQWFPPTNVLTKIHGYWVITLDFWYPQLKSIGKSGQSVLANCPRYKSKTPPPPPGNSSRSGLWHPPQPGYTVWLTPVNTNIGVQTVQALSDPSLTQYILQPGQGGGTSADELSFTASGATPIWGAAQSTGDAGSY
jgi:hypothetical protein